MPLLVAASPIDLRATSRLLLLPGSNTTSVAAQSPPPGSPPTREKVGVVACAFCENHRPTDWKFEPPSPPSPDLPVVEATNMRLLLLGSIAMRLIAAWLNAWPLLARVAVPATRVSNGPCTVGLPLSAFVMRYSPTP